MAGSWRSNAHPGGRYWFHLHTTHTHGESTASEYLALAHELGIEQVVFLEHVRRHPSYDAGAFVREVSAGAKPLGLEAFVGFEAKILPGGLLDIDERLLGSADAVGIAEHGYPGDADSLAADFVDLVRTVTERHASQSFVWVHPGSWLRRSGDPNGPRAYGRMFDAALAAGVQIERNLKYGLVSDAEARTLAPHAVVIGLDAHSTDEARARWATVVEGEASR